MSKTFTPKRIETIHTYFVEEKDKNDFDVYIDKQDHLTLKGSNLIDGIIGRMYIVEVTVMRGIYEHKI